MNLYVPDAVNPVTLLPVTAAVAGLPVWAAHVPPVVTGARVAVVGTIPVGGQVKVMSNPALGLTQPVQGSTVTATVSKQPATLYWNW